MTERLPCVIFDLDGTLADLSHRLHHIQNKPKNWPAFFDAMAEDSLIPSVAWLFRAVRNSRVPVGSPMPQDQESPVAIICSGRPDNYRELTQRWLFAHCLAPYALYMRSEGDYRADDIVKRELLAKIREDGFDPLLVVDDRDRVVNMWRDEGLTCLQCAPGDF